METDNHDPGIYILNTPPLRLGFIGGAIDSAVGITHEISSQMDNRWKLSAGCFSRHDESNKRTAEAWGIDPEHLYSNYRELLETEHSRLDAIAVLTPTPSHAEIVIETIKRGYPVICEKALATSSIEGNNIKKAVEKYNGYLAVTYNYTGYPMVRELQVLVARGALGQLQQIHIEMPQEGFIRLDEQGNRPIPQSWRLKDQNIPTLSLDLGVHLHHMAYFLSGERPFELVATCNNYGFFKDIIDNTICTARYSNDLDCQFWFGKTALGNTNGLRVRLYGEEGSAEWYQLQPESLILHDNQGRKRILERSSVELTLANQPRYNRFKAGHPAGFIEGFANLYFDLADSIECYLKGEDHSSPWIFGADIALEGLQMLETISRSSNNRCWESIYQ